MCKTFLLFRLEIDINVRQGSLQVGQLVNKGVCVCAGVCARVCAAWALCNMSAGDFIESNFWHVSHVRDKFVPCLIY